MNNLLEVQNDAPHTQAEFKVQAILNSMLRLWRDQQLSPRVLSGLTIQLKDVCRKDPTATWHALSQLDQVHRRGIVSSLQFRELKRELNDIVFCNTGKYEDWPTREAAEQMAIASTQEIKVEEPGVAPLRIVPRNRSAKVARLVVQNREKESANAKAFDPLRAGSVLNHRYIIVEPLTAGSATITFKALDKQRGSLPESERHVAIRWLEEHLQDNRYAMTAMQNEFAQLQLIAHPAIPKVFDIHTLRGSTFIAMELPSGESLSRILERIAPKRLSLADALTLIREIGYAIANAHRNGITHGSLHPGSVRIAHSGELRIYGFAQADSFVDESTAPGHSQASPMPTSARRYCSPQRMRSTEAHRSDDLYSLACIAYEVLCGEPVCVETLRVNEWQAPDCAKHLSKARWQALVRGLSQIREHRGYDVRRWLQELGMEEAEWELPGLATLGARAQQRKSLGGAIMALRARL
jgi:hypothetical protein